MINYERRAKTVIRQLQGLGNFDEFRDHREADGINAGAVDIIVRALEKVARDCRAKEEERPEERSYDPLFQL